MATVTSSKRQLTHTSNTYESNGDVTIGGNLNINGTTTTIDTANLLVEDKNIIIGDVSSPSDTTADGGGITLKGASDKTINWVNSTDSWTSNQRFSAPNLTLTGLSNQSSEATALVVNGSNVVGTRELGSNAFNSTSFLTSYTETDTLATVTARGRTTSTNGSAVWDTTTQGTTQGSLHLMSIGSDNAGGAITFDASDSSGAQAGIYVRSDGSYGTKMYLSTTDSFASGSKSAISINHQGYVNIVRGNDRLTVNGNTVWHAGNDGTGSGLDADLLDGAQPSVSASNNTIVKRHSSGYIYANYINTTANDVSSGVTRIMVETGNDGFMRHGDKTSVLTYLNVDDGADVTPSWVPSTNPNYLTSLGTAIVDGDFTANGLMKRTGAGTYTSITDNSSNWNTAYTDRNKWDGGSTGLNASTGRTSLGLGSAATSNTSAFAAAGDENIIDGATSIWNADGDGDVFNYNDSNPTHNGKYVGAVINIHGDGSADSSLVRAGLFTSNLMSTLNGYYVGALLGNANSTTTQVINGSGVWTGSVIPAAKLSTATTQSSSENSTKIATTAYVKSQGYVTSSGNTIIGTDADITTSSAEVVNNIYMTDGVITSHTKRTLTLANLGYTGATNANNYSLPLSTSSTRGGVKIGFTESGKNYPVELSSEKMYVNVPWTDTNTNTTYSAGNGISLSSTTFSVAAGGGLTQTSTGLSHTDTSSQSSVNNSNGTVIQDITLDTYGHITAIGSANLDSRYYTETEVVNHFKTLAFQGNYMNTYQWSTDSSGSVDAGWGALGTAPYYLNGSFANNGSASENIRSISLLPNGSYGVVWRTPLSDTDSGADGGWNCTINGVQDSKLYRSVVYFRRTADVDAGTFYHGCNGSHTLNVSNATANTNPYFHNTGINDNFVVDRWYVSVGYIQPHQSGGSTDSNKSGIYDCVTGKKIISGNDFMMKSGSTEQQHRTYIYYTTNPSTEGEFWGPRFEEVNGNEPSIRELIAKGADGVNGMTIHSEFDPATLGQLTESSDANDDKFLLWDQSAGVWKYMRLDDLQDAIDTNTTYSLSSFGITATSSELNFTDGVTSNIQTQLNGKQASGTYNTIIGTDSDINTSGSTIIDNIFVTDGVITSMGTRTLTLANLGYTGATNANNYSLPLAASGTRGGVKIGYSENGKNYPVEINSSEQMFVNVPWVDTNTNTTYSAGTGITLSGTTFSLTDTNSKLNLSGGTLTGTLTSRDIKLGSGYHLQRSDHHSGHLEGSYNNVGANAGKSNPIYTIGSSYNPTDAALSNMYGIGYSHTDASFISFTGASGWGQYVAADGDARIFLCGSNGVISSTGEHYVGSNRVHHNGYHPNADTLTTARTIALGGDVTGSASFNGGSNITISASLSSGSVGASEIAANAVGASEIAASAVGASELNVSGNGTTAQFLRSDGDGTFTWATPTDTNTTYSVGDGGLTQKNFTTTLKSKLDGIAASANNYVLPTTISGTRNFSGLIYANAGLRLGDNDLLQLGDSQDLDIAHNSVGQITNKTGDLYISSTAANTDIIFYAAIGATPTEFYRMNGGTGKNTFSRPVDISANLDVNGTTTSSGFLTDTSSTQYNLLTRNHTSNTLYVQAAQSGGTQPIATFRYGSTTANAGTEVLAVRRNSSYFVNTKLGVGTSSPQTSLDVSGTIHHTIYNATSLPSASPAGQRAFAYSFYPLATSHGSVVSTNGSYVIPVYSDGSSWRAG